MLARVGRVQPSWCRSRGHRPELRGPAGRGGPPGRRTRPGPAAGDDVGGRGGALVPLQGAPAGPGDRLVGHVVRRLRGARGHRTPGSGCCRAPRCSAADRGPVVGRRGARPGAPGPPDGYADAWSFTAPVVDMPVYLRWLRARLDELGGTLTRMSLAALPQTDDVVVNCAGLGSRRLAGDLDVRPVRGQVVLVEGIELDRWWLDSDGPTYVVPALRHGGRGRHRRGRRLEPDPVAGDGRRRSSRRASRLVPEVAGAHVVGHRVGLRPVRPEVRLEAVGRVVHCYGQGGAGVTVSWGCADEVVDAGWGALAEELVHVGTGRPRRCRSRRDACRSVDAVVRSRAGSSSWSSTETASAASRSSRATTSRVEVQPVDHLDLDR